MSKLESLDQRPVNIGIVADLHADPSGLHVAAALRKHNVDAVAFLGDAPGNFNGSMNEHLREISDALLGFDNIGVPIFWIPGNYENNVAYRMAFRQLEDRLDNVIDVSEKNVVPFRGNDLIFVPGSSVFYNGYCVTPEVPTGDYAFRGAPTHVFNPNDLKTLVKNPDKTVVFAHHPPLIKGNYSIDLAIHAFNGIETRYMGDSAIDLIRRKKASKTILSHRGDPVLAEILKECGVQKFFSGDIHEARSIVDSAGNPIQEGQYSKELFGNPGAAKDGYYGIATFNNGECAMRTFNVTGEKVNHFDELRLR